MALSLPQAIYRKKNKFYGILDELELQNIQLFDYFDKYCEQYQLFTDPTHLNTAGAKEFTKQINIDVPGCFGP